MAEENVEPALSKEKQAAEKAVRLRLRMKYTEQMAYVQEHKEELAGGNKSDRLLEMLEAANACHEQVKHTREQAMDTEYFVLLTDQVNEQVKRLRPGASTISVGEFLAGLRLKHVRGWDPRKAAVEDPNMFRWDALGRIAYQYFRHISYSGHMLGPMELKPKAAKERKKPERREKEALQSVVNPEAVGADVNKSTSETEKLMRQVAKILHDRKGTPVDALRLVFNRNCFAQTVENIFALSFLAKENRVILSKGPGGKGISVVMNERSHAATGTESLTQFAFRIDQHQWAALRDKMPEAPSIPHREPVPDAVLVRERTSRPRGAHGAGPSSQPERSGGGGGGGGGSDGGTGAPRASQVTWGHLGTKGPTLAAKEEQDDDDVAVAQPQAARRREAKGGAALKRGRGAPASDEEEEEEEEEEEDEVMPRKKSKGRGGN